MADVWAPTTNFEARLAAAVAADDGPTALGLLRHAQLAFPLTPGAAGGSEPAAWATHEAQGRTWLMAYTSAEAMEAGTDGRSRHLRVLHFVQLAAGYPDTRWPLAVNAGLPGEMLLESGTVARLAVPSLPIELTAAPDAVFPVMQKLLTAEDVHAYLTAVPDRCDRVSGYVHRVDDAAGLSDPAALIAGVGRVGEEGDLLSAADTATVLRWPSFGAALYRSPFGGVDPERMAAVEGWVVEDPPFVGTGFVPDVDSLVREYKVDAVPLPHGAEMWELRRGGEEQRRAVFDADRGRWMFTRPESGPDDGGDAGNGTPDAGGAPW